MEWGAGATPLSAEFWLVVKGLSCSVPFSPQVLSSPVPIGEIVACLVFKYVQPWLVWKEIMVS